MSIFGNCPGWELSGMRNVRDGECPAGIVRDGNCPELKLSCWWEMFGMGTVLDGICTGIALNARFFIVLSVYIIFQFYVYTYHHCICLFVYLTPCVV